MMNAEEREYMDYLIHNRTQMTIEIGRHLDEILLLQKKLDIAVKALKFYSDTQTWDCCIKNHCAYVDSMVADIALKEMEEVK